MKKIIISSKNIGIVEAELSEENSPKTVELIWSALPIKAKANTWGNEIYFPIGVTAKLENARDLVEKGDLGYWPIGKAFCIFFGRTPASKRDEIRAASPVNILGKVLGDPDVFKKIRDGENITLNRD